MIDEKDASGILPNLLSDLLKIFIEYTETFICTFCEHEYFFNYSNRNLAIVKEILREMMIGHLFQSSKNFETKHRFSLWCNIAITSFYHFLSWLHNFQECSA